MSRKRGRPTNESKSEGNSANEVTNVELNVDPHAHEDTDKKTLELKRNSVIFEARKFAKREVTSAVDLFHAVAELDKSEEELGASVPN